MICLICWQADTVDSLRTIHFERGANEFVIHHLPAQVCPNCDEAYVDEEVAERVLQVAEEMFAAGILVRKM